MIGRRHGMTAAMRQELQKAVRIEKMELQQELIQLSKRIGWIENRLSELEKADNLLEGE
jgi:predicted ribosome quality control (RQC) complex YloA/Tae2 family protein